MNRTRFKPIRDQFLVFGSPAIEDDEIDEVLSSMRSGWLGTGPKVARFEKDFSAYKGIAESRAAAVNSCTAALHVSLIAAELAPGDEVITSAMTFCATVNAIIHSGATPVLADIDPTTLNINPADIEQKISPRTKAVVPVHFGGRPCEMNAITSLASRYGLKIIEDCAHAIETEYHGRKTGTFGDFGCFSFYVTKNVVTGEGGMVVAKRDEDIQRIKRLALHGMSQDAWRRFSDSGFKHYRVVECGFKYNMMDLQAAIGIHQLARVEKNWLRRQAIWNRYQEAFTTLPVGRPTEPAPETRHGYHLYTLMIDELRCGVSRDDFLDAMAAQRIGVGVHYVAIPEHPYYQQNYEWRADDYPVATQVGRQTVSLPISARLREQDVEDVITAVGNIISGSSRS